MKKSSQVPASLVVALAGLMGAGCGARSYDECVDPSGRVVSDDSCRTGRGGAHYVHRNVESGGFGGSGGSGGFFGG